MFSNALKSKTVIFNALVVAAGTLAYLSNHELVVSHPEWVAGLGAAAGVINVVLRFFTVKPLAEK